MSNKNTEISVYEQSLHDHFSLDEILLVKTLIKTLGESPDYCFSLDEITEIVNIRRSLLSIYLSELATTGIIVKKRKYVNRRRLTIYCLNMKDDDNLKNTK